MVSRCDFRPFPSDIWSCRCTVVWRVRVTSSTLPIPPPKTIFAVSTVTTWHCWRSITTLIRACCMTVERNSSVPRWCECGKCFDMIVEIVKWTIWKIWLKMHFQWLWGEKDQECEPEEDGAWGAGRSSLGRPKTSKIGWQNDQTGKNTLNLSWLTLTFEYTVTFEHFSIL